MITQTQTQLQEQQTLTFDDLEIGEHFDSTASRHISGTQMYHRIKVDDKHAVWYSHYNGAMGIQPLGDWGTSLNMDVLRLTDCGTLLLIEEQR
jgi:hypothetical protein